MKPLFGNARVESWRVKSAALDIQEGKVQKIGNCQKKMIIALLAGLLVFAARGLAQTPQGKTASKSSQITPNAKRKDPTLGFAHIKDVSPVLDQDALLEEQKLEKKLPGNEFVKDKRAMHEAALMNEFIEGFQKSKQCHDITFYLKSDKKPDFMVQIGVSNHDDDPDNETWTWILSWPADPSPTTNGGHGMGGMGSQRTAALYRQRCVHDHLG